MKPPPLAYMAPVTLEEALHLLNEHGGAARPLAGGQSLVPLLNFRLARPEALIDLNRIHALTQAALNGSALSVGAMTRTARLLAPDIAGSHPVLTQAARLVGHPQIRSRGTVGGSIAHADPAAELCAAAVLLGASIELESVRGSRTLAAAEFFQGVFSTACEWDELVVAVTFPSLDPTTGWGFREFARRPGDFALAGVGAVLSLEEGRIDSLAVTVFGLGGPPLRARLAEEALRGRFPNTHALAAASEALVEEVTPSDSLHASPDYQRHLVGVLLEQSIRDALGRTQ